MDRYAIIVAAGSGSRMHAKLPKQFMPLGGKPIIFHSIAAFAGICSQILLVIQEKDFNFWSQLCKDYNFTFPIKLVAGGSTRHESVKNAMHHIPNNVMVAIHDGARPLVTPTLVNQLLVLAEEKGNAVPVLPLKDSIRQLSNAGNTAVNRNHYVSVQTPQCFKSTELKQAIANAAHNQYSDEASLLDDFGKAVNLNEGQRSNIKITNPEDLVIAEVLLMAMNKAKSKR